MLQWVLDTHDGLAFLVTELALRLVYLQGGLAVAAACEVVAAEIGANEVVAADIRACEVVAGCHSLVVRTACVDLLGLLELIRLVFCAVKLIQIAVHLVRWLRCVWALKLGRLERRPLYLVEPADSIGVCFRLNPLVWEGWADLFLVVDESIGPSLVLDCWLDHQLRHREGRYQLVGLRAALVDILYRLCARLLLLALH